VQTGQLIFGQTASTQDAIAHAFGLKASAVSVQLVGPTWGSQISQKAIEALIAFLIVIVAYLSIAFEWRMAGAAFVALAHDIVITVGVYALTGFHVSPATVIGLLTILGYSLYDTVVVFDKVRENTAGLLGTRRSTYSQAANLALNQTLVRSINTSLIALLPVAAILIVSTSLLGNGELKDLSLVLFVGMLSGTYSSICIATPVLADLKERQPQFKQLARQVALRAAGGRAAARKAKGAPASPGAALAAGPATATATATATDAEPDGEGQVAEPSRDSPTDEPVPVGRTASGSPAPRASAGARPGPRQQPRRSSAAKRRPGGKKKRR
jgi:preprotein translocase subunit SecF